MSRNRFLMLLAGGSAAGAAALLYWSVLNRGGGAWLPPVGNVRRVTVEDRVAQYGERADARLRPAFERAGVAYPPAKVALRVF